MAERNENDMIARVVQGDQAAFKTLVNDHKKNALRLAWRYTGDMDEAEDIVQDAFIQAYRSMGNFRGESSFGSWLYRIVVNMSLNHIKKKKRFIFTELDEDMAITDMNGRQISDENLVLDCACRIGAARRLCRHRPGAAPADKGTAVGASVRGQRRVGCGLRAAGDRTPSHGRQPEATDGGGRGCRAARRQGPDR